MAGNNATKAYSILAWVEVDPVERAAEGLKRLGALRVPDDDPDAPVVRGVGETLYMMADAAEFLKSSGAK